MQEKSYTERRPLGITPDFLKNFQDKVLSAIKEKEEENKSGVNGEGKQTSSSNSTFESGM